jgi:glycosyltransferase involved in cell wall biosynthesis
MKILLAFTHMKMGGLSTYNYTLANELVRRGYIVHIWTHLGGDFEPYMKQICDVVSFPDSSYDLIIFSNNDVAEFLDKSKIKGFRIYITHGIAYKNDIPSKGMADKYVGISPYIHKYIFNNTNVGYVHYIPPGIDLSVFYPKSKINKQLTNVISLVKSETANEIVKIACQLHNVNFIGWMRSESSESIFNVSDAINDADLVVGWGRTIMESIACGRVSVCYDINQSIIDNGDNKLLSNINTENVFGLVTPNNINLLMTSNFSTYAGYSSNFNVKSLINQFLNYDSNIDDYYRTFSLNHFDIKTMVDRFFNLVILDKYVKNS